MKNELDDPFGIGHENNSKPSEPAFPAIYDGNDLPSGSPGMTLRQWYKGMAIGKLSTDDVAKMFMFPDMVFVGDDKRKEAIKHFVEIIGLLADALLEEDAARERSEVNDG